MDRLCIFYEKLRRVVWQGIRVSAVCTACYGWWGVIYPELAMLPSTYEIVCEEQAGESEHCCQPEQGRTACGIPTARSIGRFWRRIRSRSGSRADCLRC
mgnify:CR=1 FL=1